MMTDFDLKAALDHAERSNDTDEDVLTALRQLYAARPQGLKLEFKALVQAAQENQLGRLREHFIACDGFEAAQDMARLVDTLASVDTPRLWHVLQAVHRWQR